MCVTLTCVCTMAAVICSDNHMMDLVKAYKAEDEPSRNEHIVGCKSNVIVVDAGYDTDAAVSFTHEKLKSRGLVAHITTMNDVFGFERNR